MTMRPYTTSDYDAVIALFLLNSPKYFCPDEQNDLELFLREDLEHYFVIEEDGQVLASGGSNIEEHTGWLSWYMVHPEHHGKGFGKRIAEHNLRLLQSEDGLSGIEVWTSQLVYPFYEKLGFVLMGTEDNYWGLGMHLYKMKLL